MAVRKKTDIPSDIPLPIVLDDYNSCSITLSAEGITFIKVIIPQQLDNPLQLIILCIVKKKRQRVPQACSCDNLQ